jgi:hypothetical protein
MTNILYLCGVVVAAAGGYLGYEWWVIFIGSACVALGHMFDRLSHLKEMANRDPLVWLKLPAFNTLWLAIVTGPLYGLGYLLRSLTS